jgi:hypothetical protein
VQRNKTLGFIESSSTGGRAQLLSVIKGGNLASSFEKLKPDGAAGVKPNYSISLGDESLRVRRIRKFLKFSGLHLVRVLVACYFRTDCASRS